MTSIWKGFRRSSPQPYTVGRLVDRRVIDESQGYKGGLHIICDIDKTYLETEFESLVRMARIAFEAATDKVTVTGASAVLLAARWGAINAPYEREQKTAFPRPLHFVSSSPPQLRGVLEEKLMLDGLDWSTDTFKNQAYNIRMGRMDLLRQHVAYKSLAILEIIAQAPPGSRFYMIGDNAESDAFIYLGVKLLLDGRLSAEGYGRYLTAAGVEESLTNNLATFAQAPPSSSVEAILIRNVPGYEFVPHAPLTDPICVFDNFYQAGLILMAAGLIVPENLWDLTRRFHNHHGMSQAQLSIYLDTMKEVSTLDANLRSFVEEASGRLVHPPGTERSKSLGRALNKVLSSFEKLTEDEVIRAAHVWMESKVEVL